MQGFQHHEPRELQQPDGRRALNSRRRTLSRESIGWSGIVASMPATCSLDQLLLMLTWLGDDVEVVIRPPVPHLRRQQQRNFQQG